MPDYSKTKIYYIKVGSEKYYGHTATSLSKRKDGHKAASKTDGERKIYRAIREAELDWKDIHLVLVEKYPCADVEEARARERWWIEQFGTLNERLPTHTVAEKKAQKAVWDKVYNEGHKEQVALKSKEWREKNVEKVKESRSKQANKDRKNEIRRATIHHCDICDCDISGGSDAFKRHCNREPHILKAEGKWEEHLRNKQALQKEKEQAQKRAYREKNKEKAAAYQKEYRKTYTYPEGHDEYKKEHWKNYYATHREQLIQKEKERYEAKKQKNLPKV